MDTTLFLSYYNQDIDNNSEEQFLKSMNDIDEQMNKLYVSESQKRYAVQKLKDEQYRSIRKFSRSWSKMQKDIYVNNTQEKFRNYLLDYRLDKQVKNLLPVKINDKKFKQSKVYDTTSYMSMNARIVLYNSVVNCVNAIDKIVVEPVYEDNPLGETLSKLIKQMQSCGYCINLDNKSISEFPSYVDIVPAFVIDNDKTLGELDYSPSDVFRFANAMIKLKSFIFNAGSVLQDKLKTKPEEFHKSDNTTITGLLYYSLPETNIPFNIKTRMLRLSVLNSIFQAICNYSFELDYNSIINLLDAVKNAQR